MSAQPPIRITGLFIYPVKSGRGIALQTAHATRSGLAHDRRFMIVDPAGAFVTQRELGQLAQLVPVIDPDSLARAPSDDVLTLTFPGLPPLRVPLVPNAGSPRQVRVWNDTVQALDLGAEAATWLSTAFGRPLSLVFMPDSTRRQVSLDYAAAGDQTAFSDGFPYLLANEGSLADLNARLPSPIEMSRFRPNIVVAGAAAFAEDGWARIALGELPFEVVKPCTRCVITTADPLTGERLGKEPLATLTRYHSWRNKPIFAQNMLPRGEGVLRVGDELSVIRTGVLPA